MRHTRGYSIGMVPGRDAVSRLVERVVRQCALARDPLELFERVADQVRLQIPYAAAGWILIDPETMLINGVYAENVDRTQHLQLIACELLEDDINKFWDLADRGVAAAALSADTGGNLSLCTRWARIYRPNGFGDELRAVFAAGGTAWGHACLTRRSADAFFSRDDVELVAKIAPHIGNGIRIGYLLGDLVGGAGTGEPALVILADDGTVESATPQATDWLGSPDDDNLDSTIVLHEVAQQARRLSRPGACGPPAMARARARDGAWMMVRGARLDGPHGRTALVIEPARRSDLAPILLGLHQLTNRERQVTQLLLRGMSIAAIASELWISPETLRGHVKTVFGKLGVSSRPELAAMLSHEPRSRVRPA